MTDVVGRGTIELVGDARKLKATIEDAKKATRTLGEGQKEISKSAQQSIDKYVGKLQQQNATLGKTSRETEIYKLALRGASNEQINAANTALLIGEAQARNKVSIEALKSAFIGLGTVAVTGIIAAAAAFDQLVKRAGDFQDMAEKIGDTGQNVASLAVSAAVGGVAMDELVASSVKLTKNLTGVDDESQAAGAAIAALGLNLDEFKKLNATDQIETVAKAMEKFDNDASQAAVAVALFGKSGAQMLPFLKELAKEGGRQVILTDEQIRQADEYSDKQRKLRAEISLYAQAIATQMLPAYNDLNAAFLDLIKSIAGVEAGSNGLKNNTGIQDFAESAAKALAFLGDSADGVVRVVEIIGTHIAANVALQAAILKGEIGGALEIIKRRGEEVDRILNRPTLGRLLEQRRNERKNAPPEFRDNFDSDTQGKKKLNFTGAVKDDKGAAAKARAEAAAQLAFDLEEIRKASDATISTFVNSEKILEARRAAALVSDKDYFEAKRGFIVLNSNEQEAALQKEIDRLEQEKLIGKDRIDNDRKIADARAKLAKVRAAAVVDLEITGIQESAANAKIAQSYVDAKIAADAYIASIIKRNQIEIDGIGRGAKFREIQSGRSQIDDKFTAQRLVLERDLRNKQITQETFDAYLKTARDTYQQEIALYDQRTAAILAKEADWTNGATEAMQNYIDNTANVARQTEELFTHAFQGIEDAIVSFVQTGKLNFKSLADSIVTELIRIQVRQALAGIIGSVSGRGSGSSVGAVGTVAEILAGKADGGPVEGRRPYIVGERGPELFVPSMSGIIVPNHQLAAQANGRGGNQIVVHNNFNVSGAMDGRSRMQVAAAAGEGVQRAMARNT